MMPEHDHDNATPEMLSQAQSDAARRAEAELEEAFGTGAQPEQPPAGPDLEAVGPTEPGGGAAVVGDIARGATEIPRAVFTGTRDAVRETLDLVDSVAVWADENLPVGGIDPEKGLADLVETSDPMQDPETTTGKMAQSVVQFVTGFLGAGKLKIFRNLKPATKTGQVGKAGAQGAVADFSVFDPHEERLSDLLTEVPALRNPVTEYLKADPTDSEAEGRLKNSLEGLGLGVALDGFIRSLRALRRARKAREAERAGDEVDLAQPSPREEMEILGEPDVEDLFVTRAVDEAPDSTGTKVTAGEGEGQVFINFARIDSSGDIKTVMQQMADASKSQIDEARRGKRTWEQTKLSAEQKNAWKLLKNRRQGEAMNAEEAVAARQLWVTSAGKLRASAVEAMKNPSEANMFAFRKMLAVHNAIQKEVIAVRTETARSLNAWKIPVGEAKESSRVVKEILEEFGGDRVNRKLAERVAALSESGMARELEKFAEGSAWAKTQDAVAQVWINALLTNPTTHFVNAMSNFSVAGQQIIERGVAARWAQVLGDPQSVQVGEATEMMFGAVEGMKDALRTAVQMRRLKFLPEDTSEALMQRQKVEVQPGRLSAETWNIKKNTPLGMAFDGVDMITRTPGAALRTADEWFKSMGYRMELHAQALRQARSEVADGTIKPDGVKKRIAEIIEDPPENIKLAAVDQALYNTFTKVPADLPKGLGDWVHRVPIIGRLVLPFKNTPINIMTYSAERSPFAPLVREWRNDIKAGGARRDIAMTRMALGNFTMLAAMDMTLNGRMTGSGPTHPGERQNQMRQNIQFDSIKGPNDTWYSYSRADPIGMTFGMAASMAEIITNASQDEDASIEEAMVGASLSIAKAVTSKTYMQGISQALDALSDPDRYGERWFQKASGSLVPAGAAMVARQIDPYMRQAQSMIESIQRRTPWWSRGLPPYRDLWGRKIDYRSPHGALFDAVSPIYAKRENPEPIDQELERLEYFPQMPSRQFQIEGVTMDLSSFPEAYSRYVQLAGNEIEHPAWGLGAKDFLNAVVEGNHPMSTVYELYSDGPDGGKADFIREAMSDYRERAKQQLLDEFPELRVDFESRRQYGGGKLDPRLMGR